uniref:helix-turn-helix domain-containing protein n=1 Tax=Nocardia amamiensis TaxID=404578 RepID=UPI001471D9BD
MAVRYGVSRQSIYVRKAKYQSGGLDALRPPPRLRTHEPTPDPRHQRNQLGHNTIQHHTTDLPAPTNAGVVAVLAPDSGRMRHYPRTESDVRRRGRLAA